MLSKKSTLVLIVAMVLVASVMFVLAVAPASAQRAKPTDAPTATPTATATATATVKPAVPTATAVPPTATKVPPTATAVPPTATATKVPPTATKVPTKAPVFLRRGPNSVPGPSGSFSSAFTIQNLGSSTTTCSYQFYNSTGTNVYTSSTFTITVGSSNFTYVPNIAGLSSGQYSGVVSCDQQIAAVVNSSNATNLNNSGDSYNGIDSTHIGTTLYAPNAFNNYYGFYSDFVIQNTTSSPVNTTLQIINGSGGVVATQNANAIPPYASVGLDQTGLAGLNPNVAYSAIFTSTGSIGVEANIYGTGTYTNELYSYIPLTGGSTTVNAPVVMNNYYGYNTTVNVQNIGSVSTNITVTYGTGLQQFANVNPSSVAVFYNPSSGLPSGTLTSAKIQSSGQPIIVLVNESNNYLRAGSFTGFASGTQTVNVPIIMKRYYGYNTSVTCQNIGSSSTNMTITYATTAQGGGVGNPPVPANPIPANGTALFYQPNESVISNGYNGSAVITSSSQPIVCIVNESRNEGADATTSADWLYVYSGINQ